MSRAFRPHRSNGVHSGHKHQHNGATMNSQATTFTDVTLGGNNRVASTRVHTVEHLVPSAVAIFTDMLKQGRSGVVAGTGLAVEISAEGRAAVVTFLAVSRTPRPGPFGGHTPLTTSAVLLDAEAPPGLLDMLGSVGKRCFGAGPVVLPAARPLLATMIWPMAAEHPALTRMAADAETCFAASFIKHARGGQVSL